MVIDENRDARVRYTSVSRPDFGIGRVRSATPTADDWLRWRKVPVVDTVGAGDSFMAGLVSGLLDANLLGSAGSRARLETAGWPQVAPAVHRAVACSAITVGRAGANPPTRRELS